MEHIYDRYEQARRMESKSYIYEGALSKSIHLYQTLLETPIPEPMNGELQIRLGLGLAREEYYLRHQSTAPNCPARAQEVTAIGLNAKTLMPALRQQAPSHVLENAITLWQSELARSSTTPGLMQQRIIISAKIGNALTRLGIRSTSDHYFDDSIASLRAALYEWDRLLAHEEDQNRHIPISRIRPLIGLMASIRDSLDFAKAIADPW